MNNCKCPADYYLGSCPIHGPALQEYWERNGLNQKRNRGNDLIAINPKTTPELSNPPQVNPPGVEEKE